MNSTSQSAVDAEKLFQHLQVYTIICFLMSTIGFLPNFSIVYVSFKYRLNKSICNTYNYLLGLSCAFDMAQEFGTFLTMILHVFRLTIPLSTCFAVQWYDLFALNMVYQILFLIALDRLVAIIFPLSYIVLVKGRSGKIVLFSLIFPIIHISYYFYLITIYVVANANKPVYCYVSDFSRGYTFLGALIINLSTIGIYAIIWIILRFGRKFQALNHRIFKSLVLITVVHFVCWLIPVSVKPFIFPLFSLDSVTTSITGQYLGMGVRLSATLNIFVIFFCSEEYRELLVKEFKFYSLMANAFRIKNSTVIMGTNPITVRPIEGTNMNNFLPTLTH